MVGYAETWDANVFCQERNQLFKLSGYLHDQVELTETGRSLTETTSRASHSPRARPAAARAAATRNHQQAARPEPHANHVNHRAPPANPRRDNVQVHLSHLLFSSACVIVLSVLSCAQCRSTICSLQYGIYTHTAIMFLLLCHCRIDKHTQANAQSCDCCSLLVGVHRTATGEC